LTLLEYIHTIKIPSKLIKILYSFKLAPLRQFIDLIGSLKSPPLNNTNRYWRLVAVCSATFNSTKAVEDGINVFRLVRNIRSFTLVFSLYLMRTPDTVFHELSGYIYGAIIIDILGLYYTRRKQKQKAIEK